MNQRKKILWLVSWYPHAQDPFDGDFIQRHARAAAIYHDVHVIFVKHARQEMAVKEDWNFQEGLTEQVICFQEPKGILAPLRRQLSWKTLYAKAVKKYINKHGNPHLVHVHVPWKAGWMALWIKKTFGIPFIVTEHWGIYDRSLPGNLFGLSKITRQVILQVYRQARAFTTVSDHLASQVQAVTGRRDDIIIPNVVDTTLFYPREEKYSRFSFIHISNMAAVKNVSSILDAFKQLKDRVDEPIQLILVGNRDDEYVNKAAAMGLLNDSVFFRGEISYQQVAEEMQRCHCLAMFSDSETFSCVTAEALCCGLPVVSSRVGAIPELVSSGSGWLVNPGDVVGLAAAMEKAVREYPMTGHKQIASRAASLYSYSAISEKFDGLYRKIC